MNSKLESDECEQKSHTNIDLPQVRQLIHDSTGGLRVKTEDLRGTGP